MNDDIESDRSWTAVKEYRKEIDVVTDKLKRYERLNDFDMKVVNYALQVISVEIYRRHVRDLEEEVEMKNFGVDNPPSE